jgi:hypothetical protein
MIGVDLGDNPVKGVRNLPGRAAVEHALIEIIGT